MDLALFLTSLSLKGNGMRALYAEENSVDGAALDPATCRARLAQLDELREVFLAHYEQHAAVSQQRVALWEACYLFTFVLHFWVRVKPVRLTHMLMLLERHGRTMGLW
jgi:hypothetical protein